MTTPLRRCIVCHRLLPSLSKYELYKKGAAMDLGDGQFIYHCPEGRHTEEEIRKAINSVPEFCNGKLKEVSREENLQMTDGQIEIVFQCQNCKKEPMAIFEFEGYYDEDDNLIEGFL